MEDEKKIEIDRELLNKLYRLARRSLHIAYTWNDHNFKPAREMARDTAAENGINSIDEANEFLISVIDLRD